MKNNHRLILILFSCCFIYGCDPCRNLDCLYSDYSGQFRIIDKVDGKDLVFGNTRLYEKQKIKFFSVKGNDTTFYPWQEAKNFGAGDSVILVNFFPQTDTAYLRLNETDVDTLAFNFTSQGSRCCGTVTEIESFRLNNSVTLPGKNNLQVISK